MCLLAFHWQPNSDLPLQVWANRDEFLARPAAPTQQWPDAPHILAGRDLVAGGTWMGVTLTGRFAAITNFRDPTRAVGLCSRGELAAQFLSSEDSALIAAERIAAQAGDYAGFNLLLCDGQQLFCVDDRSHLQAVSPGWHGLSNARLNTPWPKVRHLVGAAKAWSQSESLMTSCSSAKVAMSADHALALLSDTANARDNELPDTGVGILMERALSPICIRTPIYGTRNSTWLRVSRERIEWHEQDFNIGERIQFSLAR